jgi:hypothetical protein
MQGISTKEQSKRERESGLVVKRCACGRWFTVKGRRDRDRCFKCEETDGQAPGNQ